MQLTGLHVVITYKSDLGIFYPGDLRPKVRQFRDLPIISLWKNMKMFAVSHKPTKTTQLFQNHRHSSHL